MSDYKIISQVKNQISVKLDDGTVLSGTIFQVKKTLDKLGYGTINFGITYNSSTDGVILIASMATPHIRNAIQKKIQDWVISLKEIKDIEKYGLEVYQKLDTSFWDEEFINLIEELDKRE